MYVVRLYPHESMKWFLESILFNVLSYSFKGEFGGSCVWMKQGHCAYAGAERFILEYFREVLQKEGEEDGPRAWQPSDDPLVLLKMEQFLQKADEETFEKYVSILLPTGVYSYMYPSSSL